MKQTLRVSVWIFLCVGLISLTACAQSNKQLRVAAENAVYDWSASRKVPCEIQDIQVARTSKTRGQATVLVAVEEIDDYYAGRYGQVTLEIARYGREWEAEPIGEFGSPFRVEVLAADRPRTDQCTKSVSPSAEVYPCLRITNLGPFEFKGSLQWGYFAGVQAWEGKLAEGEHVDISPAFPLEELNGQSDRFGVQAWGRRGDPLWVYNAPMRDVDRLVSSGLAQHPPQATPTAAASPDDTTGQTTASTPTAGGLIAFTGKEPGIHVVAPDGSGLTKVSDVHPRGLLTWHPSGTKLTFFTDDAIYTVNIDGSQLEQIVAAGSNLAWSPDGESLAWTEGEWFKEVVVVADADGSNRVQLTDSSTGASHLAWSPDGARIAFVSRRGDTYEIDIIDRDGSNRTHMDQGWDQLIPKRKEPYIPDVTWSNGGRQLAIWYGSSDADIQLTIVLDVESGEFRVLNKESERAWFRAWSPDDAWVYVALPETRRATGTGLYAFAPDGSEVVFISGWGYQGQTNCLSPDGTQLLLRHMEPENQIDEHYIIDITGERPPVNFDELVGMRVFGASWAPR